MEERVLSTCYLVVLQKESCASRPSRCSRSDLPSAAKHINIPLEPELVGQEGERIMCGACRSHLFDVNYVP